MKGLHIVIRYVVIHKYPGLPGVGFFLGGGRGGGIVKQLEENNKGDKPEQKTIAPHTLRGSNLKKRKRERETRSNC